MWPPPNVHYNENRFGECIISIPIETVSKITIGSSSSACLCLMAQHIMYLVGSTKIYKINDFSAHFARAEFAIFVQCYNFGVQGFFFPPWKKKALLTYLGWNVSPHQIRPSNSTPSIPNPLTAFVACDGVQNTSDGGCGAGRAEICEAWRRDTETSWCVQQHSNATS
jgi:hypothetical protein